MNFIRRILFAPGILFDVVTSIWGIVLILDVDEEWTIATGVVIAMIFTAFLLLTSSVWGKEKGFISSPWMKIIWLVCFACDFLTSVVWVANIIEADMDFGYWDAKSWLSVLGGLIAASPAIGLSATLSSPVRKVPEEDATNLPSRNKMDDSTVF